MKFFDFMLQRLHESMRSLHFEHGERLLRTIVYGWCLLSIVVLLPAASVFWGPGAYRTWLHKNEPYGLFSDLDLLARPSIGPYYLVVIAAFLGSLVAGLCRVAPRTTAVLNYVLYHVICAQAQAIHDGGDRFIGQLLFYLMLASLATVENPTRHPIRTLIRNLAFFSTRIQLCVVYASAALAKLGGDSWPTGKAMYYVLHNEEYTLPIVQHTIGANGLLLAIATYGVVLFQLSVPYLIWRNPTRRPIMLIGTFLHLQIAFIMGLMSFGFAMIVGYAAFYTDEEARAIVVRWASRIERIRPKWCTTSALGAIELSSRGS